MGEELAPLLTLAPRSGAIYQQIIEQIKRLIVLGVLRAGEQLPTAKQLATDLTVNPNTIVRAYRELEREGLIKSTAGRGTFVRDDVAPVAARSSLARATRSSMLAVVREARSFGIPPDELHEMFAHAIRECFGRTSARASRKTSA